MRRDESVETRRHHAHNTIRRSSIHGAALDSCYARATPEGRAYVADPNPIMGTKMKLNNHSPMPKPDDFENALAMSAEIPFN